MPAINRLGLTDPAYRVGISSPLENQGATYSNYLTPGLPFSQQRSYPRDLGSRTCGLLIRPAAFPWVVCM